MFKRIGDSLEWIESEPTDVRVCAVCLEDVLRSGYDEHMAAHGYELVTVTVH